ncbi:MAG TPA: SDR family NAD(P)-dependent oxidoreductase [Polyangia bacterium]|nr:SDR family NAD(P)-dependent oxidoreductase [Polyangia bacterium]
MSTPTILVTGGTGFLGRALGRLLRERARVVLAGRNNEQNRTAALATGCEVLPMDVTNVASVRDAVVEVKPKAIIHAAASKFVDLAEKHPHECIDVNVAGSQNVARVAMEHGVESVVGISTDKATPPVRNTYGLTKALMERLFCSLDGKTATRFVCVRFGNIAWSTGSVFPIWTKMQADHDGVIGSTGPEMRRFFFSVDDAARLVVTALDHIGDMHGQVLSRAMAAAQIRDILDVWVAQKGGRWEPIAGRPGDRLDEDLIGETELPYTRELTIDGVLHFLVSFNVRAPKPLPQMLSSANAPRLSAAEIATLIEPPRER